MNLTRLLALALAFVLILRLLPLALPILGPLFGQQWRRFSQRIVTTVDVAGGLIMLIIVASVLLRGELLGAALLALIGIPVFIGTYKALPAWWRGQDDKR